MVTQAVRRHLGRRASRELVRGADAVVELLSMTCRGAVATCAVSVSSAVTCVLGRLAAHLAEEVTGAPVPVVAWTAEAASLTAALVGLAWVVVNCALDLRSWGSQWTAHCCGPRAGSGQGRRRPGQV